MTVVLSAPRGNLRWRVSLLVRALWSTVLVEFMVRRAGPIQLCERFGVHFRGFDGVDVVPGEITWDVRKQWWAVEAVLRWWPFGRNRSCLRRSLILGHRLRGLSPALCIEIVSVSPFVAHAWLAVRGHRLDTGEAGPFVAAADRPAA